MWPGLVATVACSTAKKIKEISIHMQILQIQGSENNVYQNRTRPALYADTWPGEAHQMCWNK
jgi:hypothetical protein